MINILFYKYVDINELEKFQIHQLSLCKALNLKGRVLFGKEGINGNLTGKEEDIKKYQQKLKQDPRFADIQFKEGITNDHNFKKLFVRIRDEIVTTGYDVHIEDKGDYIEPKDLKKALDNNDDIVLLDARNNYEFKIGKFRNARTLDIETFRDIPGHLDEIKDLKDKDIVTYCTGGVRCEKFSALLKKNGFKKVRQLHGGILRYGQECCDNHWDGKCFVFDTRGAIELDPTKQTEPITQCNLCNTPNDTYYNCKLEKCDKRFLCCEECLKILENCCSKKCRGELSLHLGLDLASKIVLS